CADSGSKCGLVWSASSRGSVVWPQPGGPHSTMDDSRPPAIMRPMGPSRPSRCSCPTISEIARGRSRSASGRGASDSNRPVGAPEGSRRAMALLLSSLCGHEQVPAAETRRAAAAAALDISGWDGARSRVGFRGLLLRDFDRARILALGLGVAVDQLDDAHRRHVAVTEPGLEDARVAALAFLVTLGQQ